MKFEEGLYVEYKGFKGHISFLDPSCICVASPSVIGNPWPITIVVPCSDFKHIHEVSSDL